MPLLFLVLIVIGWRVSCWKERRDARKWCIENGLVPKKKVVDE